MKYMHFNSACSYAGLANQLLIEGHSAEDTEIVTAIGLPGQIEYDAQSCCYCAGGMLQGKKWFDRYLRPLGWEYDERSIPKAEVPSNIKRGDMIGVELRPGWRHAVIFLERSGEHFRFWNNKHEGSEEEETLELSRSAFVDMLPEKAVIGRLVKAGNAPTPAENMQENSKQVWSRYEEELLDHVSQYHTFEELCNSRDPLFRALLVDTLTMMRVAREERLAEDLFALQTQYMNALRKQEGLVLAEHLDLGLMERCFAALRSLA